MITMPTFKDKKLKLLERIVQKATVCVELYAANAITGKHLCLYSYFLVTENINGYNYPFEFVYFVKDSNVPNAEWKMFTSGVVVSATDKGEYTYSFDWTNFNTSLDSNQQSFIKKGFEEHLVTLAKHITNETSMPWAKVLFRDMLLEGGYEAGMFIGNQLFNSAKNTEANIITDIASRKVAKEEKDEQGKIVKTNTTMNLIQEVLSNIQYPVIKAGAGNDQIINIELDGAFRISYKE